MNLDFSNLGKSSSSVVPGYVVLSNEIICPFFKKGKIVSNVLVTKLKSGSLYLLSGVGTQIIIASACNILLNLFVASNPFFLHFCIFSEGIFLI